MEKVSTNLAQWMQRSDRKINSSVCNFTFIPVSHTHTHKYTLTEQQAVALSAGLNPLRSVSNTFIFSTRQQRAVSVASPTFSYTPFA